jgi:hypothetical protein
MTPWKEEKRYLFQNHAVSMCERVDGGLIAEDEAYYVAGIFNAPAVAEFIYASSDNRSFKIRPPVYMPVYDSKDERHREISKLSKQGHAKPKLVEVNSQAIEKIYLTLCGERPTR